MKLTLSTPSDKQASSRALVKPFTLENLFNWLNVFYRPKYLQELNTFYRQPHLRRVEEELKQITEIVKSSSDNTNGLSALVRVGHYSHIECVTLDKYSSPKFQKGYGKTRTLAEGLVPFGWILLTAEEGYLVPKQKKQAPAQSNQDQVMTEEVAETRTTSLSPEEKLDKRLEQFHRELEAIPLNKLPGTLPGLAERILKDEDGGFASKAADSMLGFIREKKMKKKMKQKKWYHELEKIDGQS